MLFFGLFSVVPSPGNFSADSLVSSVSRNFERGGGGGARKESFENPTRGSGGEDPGGHGVWRQSLHPPEAMGVWE